MLGNVVIADDQSRELYVSLQEDQVLRWNFVVLHIWSEQLVR